MSAILDFGEFGFPKADCGRFWILASTHVDQPKSTEKLNKAILLNLRLFWTFSYMFRGGRAQISKRWPKDSG